MRYPIYIFEIYELVIHSSDVIFNGEREGSEINGNYYLRCIQTSYYQSQVHNY